MKAVYEMPKVSFEAFMANSAVSACGDIERRAFDCVRGDGFFDNHGADDQPNVGPNQILTASTAGLNGCTVQAGFADYIDWQGKGEDSVGLENPDSDNVTSSWVLGNVDCGNTGSYANADGFMGWLYITFTGGRNGTYDTTGWSIGKDGDWSWLNFSTNGLTGRWHAWLAPLFKSRGASGA